MGFPSSPRGLPAVLSLALIAPASASYSTNAMFFLPGTALTSRKPSNLAKIAESVSTVTSSDIFCTKRILFGGKYSSGMTAPAAALDGLRPAPRAVLTGRVVLDSGPAAGRFSFFCNSAASAACFLSNDRVSISGSSSVSLVSLTFLCQSASFVKFKIVFSALPEHGRIALRFRVVEDHRFVEQLEPLDLLYCPFSGLHFIEDDESLTLGFDIFLGYQVDDVAIFGENFTQGLLELVDLDMFLKVLNLSGMSVAEVEIACVIKLHRFCKMSAVDILCSKASRTYVGFGGFRGPAGVTAAIAANQQAHC